jgi:hypothetical protein
MFKLATVSDAGAGAVDVRAARGAKLVEPAPTVRPVASHAARNAPEYLIM